MTQTITATFEDGVFKPTQPPALPAHAQVRLTVEVIDEAAEGQANSQGKIYEILSRRYASGHPDTAERHNEHQP